MKISATMAINATESSTCVIVRKDYNNIDVVPMVGMTFLDYALMDDNQRHILSPIIQDVTINPSDNEYMIRLDSIELTGDSRVVKLYLENIEVDGWLYLTEFDKS